MKKITEETVLLISVFKWFILATIIGSIIGLLTGIFLIALRWSTDFLTQRQYYFLLLPIALFISSLVTKYLAPDAEGHGTEKVIEAVHKRHGKIKAMVVPVKILTTIVTLALGGSAGKEGPCAQIGGGVSSVFADMLHFSDIDREKLVICGISAGFASVFGTPIAGAIFGIEVLFIGSIMYEVLLPSFIAGLMSFQVSSALGVTYFSHAIHFMPPFSELYLAKIVLSGVFLGLCSLLFIESLKYFKGVSEKIKIWEPLKGLIGGGTLVILALLFSGRYLGLGLDTIENALKGGYVGWLDFAFKILFTCITLTFGGSGGIVTPIFFVGATFGSVYAQLVGLNPSTFAAIGMVGLLAGCANTPIAASILAVELFGPKVAPFAAVACVVSFLVTGHRSVYPSQVLAKTKSASIKGQIGREIEELEAEFQPRQKSLITFMLLYIRKWFRRGG